MTPDTAIDIESRCEPMLSDLFDAGVGMTPANYNPLLMAVDPFSQ